MSENSLKSRDYVLQKFEKYSTYAKITQRKTNDDVPSLCE